MSCFDERYGLKGFLFSGTQDTVGKVSRWVIPDRRRDHSEDTALCASFIAVNAAAGSTVLLSSELNKPEETWIHGST